MKNILRFDFCFFYCCFSLNLLEKFVADFKLLLLQPAAAAAVNLVSSSQRCCADAGCGGGALLLALEMIRNVTKLLYRVREFQIPTQEGGGPLAAAARWSRS